MDPGEGSVQRYVMSWGRPGDAAVIAYCDSGNVGAAWYRLFKEREPGYGFVDEQTPELSIAVVPSCRGKGYGEELLVGLLAQAKQRRLRADLAQRRARQPRAAPLRAARLREGRRERRQLDDAGAAERRRPTSIDLMEVDVAVLGGGPGGYTAAIRAAQLGAKTACIEKEPELGGTCLRVGCIPTKAWVQTAFSIKEAEETFAKLGVNVGEPQLDFGKANEWKAGVVKQMTSGVASLFKANGVEWVKGTGTFKDANTIAVEGGEDVTFKSAIVATGSFPIRPPIEGLDTPRCVDSTGLLAQTEVPKRLVVLGGGIIGCEFASIFKRFGSEVDDHRDARHADPAGGRGRGEGAREAVRPPRDRAQPRQAVHEGRGHRQRADACTSATARPSRPT